MLSEKYQFPDSTLDDGLKKIVAEVTGQQIVRTMIVEGGNKTHKKHIKVSLSDGNVLLVKKCDPNQMQMLRTIMGTYVIPQFQKVIAEYQLNSDICYMLLEWKDGTIITDSSEEHFDGNLQTAVAAIKKIHNDTQCQEKVRIDNSFIDEIESKTYLSRDEKKIIIQYVLSNLHYLNDRFKSIIHGDLHLQNILITNSGAMFIDLDDVCWGDPFEDLVYAANLHGMKSEAYPYYTFLEHYFDNKIPDEFWPIVNVYSIKKAMHIIEDEINRSQNHRSILSMSSILREHDYMSQDEPRWFKIFLKDRAERR